MKIFHLQASKIDLTMSVLPNSMADIIFSQISCIMTRVQFNIHLLFTFNIHKKINYNIHLSEAIKNPTKMKPHSLRPRPIVYILSLHFFAWSRVGIEALLYSLTPDTKKEKPVYKKKQTSTNQQKQLVHEYYQILFY